MKKKNFFNIAFLIILLNIIAIKADISNNDFIHIKDVQNHDNFLNISYTFNNENFIGQDISIDIWVIDENNLEIKRFKDFFPINKQDIIERNLFLELPKDSTGIYSIYLALSDDLDNFVKQNIILGKSSSTGFVIFGESKGKVIVYIIFLIIILIGIIMIIKNRKKDKQKTKQSDIPSIFR